jgi:hypothetical protein
MCDKLRFGELAVGDRFISFPVPGDDAGHGGLRGTQFIFTKTQAKDREDNALKECNGFMSRLPDGLTVIRVQ